MIVPNGIPYTKLCAALRKGRFSSKGKTWIGMRGNSIIRIEVHSEKDIAGIFIDIPGEVPSTSGRLASFSEVMDLANADMETVAARIKAEAEKKAKLIPEVPPKARGKSRKALQREAKAARHSEDNHG